MVNITILRGGFTSEWECERTIELKGKTYHVRSCSHREGYKAWQITHQSSNGSGASFVKPMGTGHWTSEDAFNAYLEANRS